MTIAPLDQRCPHASIFLTVLNSISIIASAFALIAALSGSVAAAEPADAFPPVRIIDQLQHYPVIGNSARQINAELVKHARQVEATGNGNTRSRFEIDRSTLRRDDGCELASLEIRVTIITTLPQWQSEQSAPAALRRQWRGPADLLERHEAGHRQHSIAEAQRLREELLRIGSKSSCLSLDAAIDLALQSSMQRLELKDAHFDERTWNALRDDPLSPHAATVSPPVPPFQRAQRPDRTRLDFYFHR